MPSEIQQESEPALERFVFFTDAVFAIAITLLALEIKVPVLAPSADEATWERALIDLAPSFFAFVLSFLVIGSIWVAHHAVFRLVARFNDRLIVPNLLLLMAVVLLPFSSALLGGTIPRPAPYAFYSATLLAAGLAKAWVTHLALRPEFVAAGVSPAEVVRARRQSWLLPTAAAICLGLAFVAPSWNNLGMLLLAPARRLPMFRGAHRGL